MTTERMSPLRRRMIEDMTVRGHGEKTKLDYIRAIKRFAAFLGRSPDSATAARHLGTNVGNAAVGCAGNSRCRRATRKCQTTRRSRVHPA